MWVNRPLHDSMPATFETAWWALKGALICWWRGHRGMEFFPDYDGDKHWRCCNSCDLHWEWTEAIRPGESRK